MEEIDRECGGTSEMINTTFIVLTPELATSLQTGAFFYEKNEEVMIIKTPLNRIGNKTPILFILYALFPCKYEKFVDVFGGSGSVILGDPYKCGFEVYNDYDRNLANLFRCIKDKPLSVIRELGFCTLNSRDDYKIMKRILSHDMRDPLDLGEEEELTKILFKEPEAEDLIRVQRRIQSDYDARRAAEYLRVLKYSYASKARTYGNRPYDLRNLYDQILEMSDRLQPIVVENQDFEALIKHYDSPETFFYLDPPYYTTEYMYAVNFAREDHQRLRECLGKITGKFLLSYNDCREIRELYEGFSFFDFQRKNMMANRYEKDPLGEVTIANYDMLERERTKPRQLNLFDEKLTDERIKEEILNELEKRS